MARLPACRPAQVARALERAGFVLHHTTGSHRVYRGADGRRVVVPVHTRDLKRGTLLAIVTQAGLSPEAFTRLL